MISGDATTVLPKRAFLVVGPESSGTRLVTRCLLAAGCQGWGDHVQGFDSSLEGAGNLIVWRRSLPYGQHWPDLRQMLLALRGRGYDVRVLATLRSHYCMVRSQLRARHVQSERQAERNIAEAMCRIVSFVADANLPVRYVTYEEVVHNSEAFSRTLEEWGLKWKTGLRDGNAKYLEPQIAA
jgi:hypothetical protein